MESFIKLGIAALIPVVVAVIFYLLDKKSAFARLPFIAKQIIIGVVFGAIAVLGTEWGIPVNGAQVNARDAAPMIAGLMFGGPAGIIAGFIGGIERWFAVFWGIGTFTRVACSVSTALAGIYAALLRKFIFDNKKPSWFLSLASGVVIETFHLTMVFVTNLNDVARAAEVVKACSLPMIIASSISVMLASLIISILAHDKLNYVKTNTNISQTIQRGLLICVIVCYLVTMIFLILVQTGLSDKTTDNTMKHSVSDVKEAVLEASDNNLLKIARSLAKTIRKSDNLKDICKLYELSEVNLVDNNGIIFSSSNDKLLGYDITSGEQSSAFLALLDGSTEEYVQAYGPTSFDKSQFFKYAGIVTEFGFIQIGYDSDHFYSVLAEQIQMQAHNRRIGETGYIFIANEAGTVISATKGKTLDNIYNSGIARQSKPDELYSKNIDGEDCFVYYTQAESFIIFAVYPKTEAYNEREISVYLNSFMEILVFGALFLMIYLLIKNVVVRNIDKINNTLGEITGGNLQATVNVRSNAEFANLSDDINSMVDTLKRFIDEAAARIDQELEVARNIQAASLPSVFPAFPTRDEIDLFAIMDTAKEVGGDFYDFYFTENSKLNILIADVSGKGIPAAMFMMRAKTQLKSLAENGLPINEVFTEGNAGLCEGNDAGMFVTAWQGAMNVDTGHIDFANAGHNPPVIKKADGSAVYLKGKAGFILAGMDTVVYKKQEVDLEPGDIIFLYTDGVTEATDANNELYGEDRLLKIIEENSFESMEQMCHVVKADVDAFVGDAPQFDDITMLALRYIGK